jgi:hypothetical protein
MILPTNKALNWLLLAESSHWAAKLLRGATQSSRSYYFLLLIRRADCRSTVPADVPPEHEERNIHEESNK